MRRASRPIAACSATTRLASQPARPAIDIPLFIRQISTGNALGAAKTILDANIMGGMCARVCPTETLCEEACVREAAEGKPVKIGLLQRYATDALLRPAEQLYRQGAADRAGASPWSAPGPAGLACAHKLATLGHDVDVFEARAEAGGLNEYGIAAYKTTGRFRRSARSTTSSRRRDHDRERQARSAATSRSPTLRADYDAVFLGMGPRRRQRARARGRGPAGRRGRGRVHRAAAPGGRSWRHCRSAGASSSSAAA